MRSALMIMIAVSVCFGAAQIDSIQFKKVRTDSIYVVKGIKSPRGLIDTVKAKSVYAIKDTTQYAIYDSSLVHKFEKFGTNSTHGGNGTIWNDATHRAFATFTNGMEGVLSRTIFDACNDPHDTNSTSEVSLKGYDSTDANVPDTLSAGFFKKYKMLQFFYSGTYTTKTPPAGTMILRVKINATVLCSTIVTLDPSEKDNIWVLQGTLTCKDTGTTGKIFICTGWQHGQTSGASNIMHVAPMKTIRGGATVNTTIKQKPDITAQFSSATVNSIYVCTGYWIERH
jgi:hypothetical protein